MKAIVYTQYGTPDVLSLKEVDKPVPNDNEVLVKVRAVSLNDWDLALVKGDFVNRLLNGVRRPRRTIVGSDIAGHVEVVGKDVTKFQPGDEVFGDLSGRWGGLAEYVCAHENQLAIKPPEMTFEQAAAIPQAGMLAVQALIDAAGIRSGQTLLINGAGGGVGTFGYIFGTWLPNSGYIMDDRPHFEILGAKYKNNDPESEEEIWIPIKER